MKVSRCIWITTFILFIFGLVILVIFARWKPDFLKDSINNSFNSSFNSFVDFVQPEKTETEKETYTRSKEPSAFE